MEMPAFESISELDSWMKFGLQICFNDSFGLL